MDLKHTTTTTTTAAAAADSPDTDGETPLHSQLINPFSSFPTGKTHHQPPPTAVSYKECLKNHAATIGSHALDGCGEFMPAPPDPTSLKCAACGCHRNFHRREHIINDVYNKPHFIEFHHNSSPPPPPPPPQPTNYARAPHVLLSLATSDHHHHTHVSTPGTPASINGRKRFRTKFSQHQKDKMSLFAERVGWKMQRCDDKMVMDFCNEIGIRRGVFKVWMHNNKNTIGRKDHNKESSVAPTAAATNGGLVVSSESHEEDDANVDGHDNSDQENDGGGGGGGDGGGANGSSSSC